MVDAALLETFSTRFRRPADAERTAHPGLYDHPNMPNSWDNFEIVLKSVGGVLLRPNPTATAAIEAAITFGQPAHHTTGRIVASAAAAAYVNNIPGIEIATPTTNPHAWEDVDLAIIVAELACAENAAVLLTSASLPERALAFLAQRTLVLVPENALIGGFMEAQAKVAARFQRGESFHHVTWMSGPSKTADIEQTLVIGAHGVCALAVLPLPIA